MTKLLLIADDFTGALDTGVHFVKKGIKSEVVVRKQNRNFVDLTRYLENEVIIVDTETRHIKPEEAYKIICELLVQARELNIPYFFKKTDSALRGNISSELGAMLQVAQEDVHFIPAYPKMNRYTMNGVHYIDGIEVNKSVFGKDPFEPVTESYIPKMFDAEICVKLHKNVTEDKASHVIIYDARTDRDIENIVVDLISNEDAHYFAGCAGLAKTISDYLPLSKKSATMAVKGDSTFVLSGSLNDITQLQLKYAEDVGIYHYKLTDEEKSDISYYKTNQGKRLLDEIKYKLSQSGNAIVSAGEMEGSIQKVDYSLNREKVGSTLGHLALQIVQNVTGINLFVIGGDTAVSFITQLKNAKITPISLVEEGVVISLIETDHNQFYLITKSGGFGEPDLIVKVLLRLGTWKLPQKT